MKPAAPSLASFVIACSVSAAAFAQPGGPRVQTSSAAYDRGVEEEDAGRIPEHDPPEDQPQYRNPQGAFNVSGFFGASTSESGTRFAFGLGLGYAVVTGVMPGARVVIATGADGIGGEVAATLTLTPPLSMSFTPFLLGEVGRRFEPDPLGAGWMYAGGGGIYLGDPDSSFALQLGWMFRRVSFASRAYDLSGPLVAISVTL